MNKLPAFTLMELLVAMVLSTIVVATAFTGYEIMAGRYGQYQQVNAGIREAAWMNGLLQKDLLQARLVVQNENTIRMTAEHREPVTYEFHDAYVLRRTHELADTFKVTIGKVTCAFNRQAALPGQPVDEIRLEARIGEEPELFFYRKNYPAALRVKNQPGEETPLNE